MQTTKPNKLRSGMDFFYRAKAVRLRSHHDKYLLAEEDEESVTQDRNGSSKNAKWFVEYVPNYDNVIRLKSCYGKYLTASDNPFLLGMTGRKVLQTLPKTIDSSVEWEPIRDGVRVKLKTRYGNFLRGNGGLPPWRNTVTHDIPHRTVTQDWILWDIDVVEIHVSSRHQQQPDLHLLKQSILLLLWFLVFLQLAFLDNSRMTIYHLRRRRGELYTTMLLKMMEK
jgi:hypothetical protein